MQNGQNGAPSGTPQWQITLPAIVDAQGQLPRLLAAGGTRLETGAYHGNIMGSVLEPAKTAGQAPSLKVSVKIAGGSVKGFEGVETDIYVSNNWADESKFNIRHMLTLLTSAGVIQNLQQVAQGAALNFQQLRPGAPVYFYYQQTEASEEQAQAPADGVDDGTGGGRKTKKRGDRKWFIAADEYQKYVTKLAAQGQAQAPAGPGMPPPSPVTAPAFTPPPQTPQFVPPAPPPQQAPQGFQPQGFQPQGFQPPAFGTPGQPPPGFGPPPAMGAPQGFQPPPPSGFPGAMGVGQ